jgi:thiamine biosynthesis lipoprotein
VSSSIIESRFRVFGQPCHLVINSEEEGSKEILVAAEQEFRRIEAKFDSFIPESLIGQINRRAGTAQSTALDAESRSLLQHVQVLWEESNHLYDPSTYSLQKLYGRRPLQSQARSNLQVELPLVGWSKLIINDHGAHLENAGTFLNLNSCIRPYAVDSVRKLLLRSNVTNALVDLDNDVATIGKQTDGANWLVGTRRPNGPSTAIVRFKLNNKGYSIRGDFEKALRINGELFSRSLSPIDGRPIPGLLGIAVIAESCLTACSAASIARMKTEGHALKWLSDLGLPWLAIDRKLECHGPLLRHG